MAVTYEDLGSKCRHHRRHDSGPCRAFRRLRRAGGRRGGLKRDADNALLAGVCAGIARHLGLKAKHVRIAAIVSLVIFTVPTIVAYVLMAWLAPSRTDVDERATRSADPAEPRTAESFEAESGAAEGLSRLKSRFLRLEEKFADVEAQMMSEQTEK